MCDNLKSHSEVVQDVFATKLRDKEEEVEAISNRIKEVQQSLQIVRYGSVTSMSNSSHIYGPQSESFLPSVHPSAALLTQGKRPRLSDDAEGLLVPADVATTSYDDLITRLSMGNGVVEQKPAIPAYVPPKPRPSLSAEVSEPRGSHLKAKRRIIVGNVSKWISTDDREDMSTHKWMLYVRGDKESPDVSDVVERVRFLIHQSYHPNNLIEVTKAPFQLTRRGWGEFTARVQLFFKNPRLNKPVSILHDLKLDKTYTGLQTFGAETCVEVWLQPDQEKDNRSSRR